MINNLDKILNLMSFRSDDDFYFCQILKRKKDNPEMKKHSMVIRSYYIKSADQLIKMFGDMKMLCDLNNARCVINLNRRSFKNIAHRVNMMVPELLINENYSNIVNVLDAACGKYSNEGTHGIKKWIVDIDTKNFCEYKYIIDNINKMNPNPGISKEIGLIPTKNGYHLITTGFDKMAFHNINWNKFNKPDIKDDNPTILYNP